MVDVEEESVGAFDEDIRRRLAVGGGGDNAVASYCLCQKGCLWNDVLLEFRPV